MRKKMAIVTGSASGLGREIRLGLTLRGFECLGYDIAQGYDVRYPERHRDFFPDHIDVLVNCAGVNRLAWFSDLTDELWDETMDVNVKGIWKMTQHAFRGLKAAQGTVLNIVSNAAHVPMRCSAAYNASKGAALILTKQLARELTADGITVFSVSPNKLAGTAMSASIDEQVMKTRGWTREYAQQYQLQGLLTGKETDPRQCAAFCCHLLTNKASHEALAGCDLPYGL